VRMVPNWRNRSP